MASLISGHLPCCISFVGFLLFGLFLDLCVHLDGPLPHLSGNSLPLNFDIDSLVPGGG